MWTAEGFQNTIWSDECSAQKSAAGTQVWVFRMSHEKWHKDCIHPKKHHRDVSLMVWGCFWANNCGTFCPLIVKSVNVIVYVKLFEFLVLLVIEHVKSVCGTAIFQQDGAKIHTARIVKKYMEDHNIQLANHLHIHLISTQLSMCGLSSKSVFIKNIQTL